MKNRLISALLCFMVFVTMIPIFSVSAQTSVTKTIEEIAGSPIMVCERYDFSKDVYTGVNHNMVVKVSFDEENGLVLPVGQSGYFRYIPEEYWSPISEGKFLVFKAKVANETAAFAPLWQGPTTNKEPLRASIAITASGVNGGEGAYTYRDSSYKPGTDWVEYLLTADTVDTWSVYGKKPGENLWTLLVSGKYGNNGSSSTGFYFSGAGYVKEATLYAREDNMSTSTATQAYFMEDFDKMPKYRNIFLSGGANVQESNLVLTPNSSLELEKATIPVGGYAEFRVKSNSAKTELNFGDESGALQLELNGEESRVNGTSIPVANRGDSFHLWRVVRNEDGSYTGFCQREGEMAWYRAFQNVSSLSTGVADRLSIKQYAQSNSGVAGNSFIDYIKIAGPSVDGEIVLTDGGGTARVSENGKLKHPESLCAVVNANESTDRMIVFAEYDEGGILQDVEYFEIPKSERESMVTHCVQSEDVEIRQVKVLLWDSFEGLIPMNTVKTTKGDLSSWDEDWTVVGETEMSDGIITLKPGTGKESSAQYAVDFGSQFDISWEMAVERLGRNTSVKVGNGSYATTLTFAEDSISFPIANGSKSFPYEMDNQKHQYRIVGNGENWDLYVDGSIVCDMDGVPSDSSGVTLMFTNDDNGLIRVSSVQTERYLLINNPAKTMGFDNGDTCGFTLDEPLFDDSDAGFWNSIDGCLVGNDPSVTPAQPYTSIDVETQEDYYFECRVQFKSLGNWATWNIYNQGYYMSMEVHGKYLNVHSPKSQSGEEISSSDYFEIDPEKWYNIKVTSHSGGKYARVYLDGQLVTEEELYPTSFTGGRIVFRTYGAWTEACHYKIDWVKFIPLSKQSIGVMTMPETENVSASLYTEVLESNAISVALTSMDNFDKVDTVSYRLNGKEIGTTDTYPYQVTVSDVPVGNHMVEAVCRDEDGFALTRIAKQVLLTGEQSAHYSNEISYTVSGSGAIDVQNGNHRLKMVHSAKSVVCTTDAGSETFPYGNGIFRVITDGPIAEVYWNGQFSFSFYMPMTTEVGVTFTGSISEAGLSIPQERKNYFVARNVSDSKKIYELAEFPYNHNLDFVAGQGDEFHLALNDGYYRADVMVENGTIYVWDAEVTNAVPEKIKVDTIGAKDAYYRIETSAGMVRLYKNGRWITSYRSGRSTGSATMAVDVTKGELSYLSVNDNADLYLYQDDFSGTGEVGATEFWSVYGLDMSVSDGNFVLNASGKTNAVAEINVPAGDFDLSAKVNVSSIGTSGGFWYLLNHSGTETYTKAGYSKKVSGYEIVDREMAKTLSQSSNKRANFSTGRTVQLDLKVRQVSRGEKITLYVNGTEMLSRVESSERRGKVGFMLSDCIASIEEISYRGDGKPVLGTRRSVLDNKGHADMIENERGEIYKVNGGGGFKTSDGGLTWTEVTPAAGAGLSADRYGGWNSNMLQLDDGKVLSMVLFGSKGEYGKNKYVYRVYKSMDYGNTWVKNQRAILQPDDAPLYGISATVNAFARGQSGRIYFCHHNGNSEDVGDAVVWVSDNEGETWKQSVIIDGRVQGHVLAEPVVIENDAGTRIYFRNEKGYLCYYTSPDCGETWDLENLYKTPFFAPTACFGVEMDPDDYNTVYVGWLYDNMNLFGKHQWPRTRLAIAKSTDGGLTWEYLGTANENNIIPYTNSNITINVSKDYLIIGNDLCDDATGSMIWHNGFSVIPKASQKTSKRFEQLHTQFPDQIENTKVIPDYRMTGTLAINNQNGEVLLRGERILSGADGEYLSQTVAEKYLGKTVSVPAGSTKKVGGKTFIKVADFADAYNLVAVEEEDVLIISENGDWTTRQKKALRYALDLFDMEP